MDEIRSNIDEGETFLMRVTCDDSEFSLRILGDPVYPGLSYDGMFSAEDLEYVSVSGPVKIHFLGFTGIGTDNIVFA